VIELMYHPDIANVNRARHYRSPLLPELAKASRKRAEQNCYKSHSQKPAFKRPREVIRDLDQNKVSTGTWMTAHFVNRTSQIPEF
jgi:hypothetical protein